MAALFIRCSGTPRQPTDSAPAAPLYPAEADGKASLAADYVKNASAHFGRHRAGSIIAKTGTGVKMMRRIGFADVCH